MNLNKITKAIILISILLSCISSLDAAQYSTASMYTVLRGHDQQIKVLTARMSTLQDNYASIVNSLNSINRELQQEKQQNIKLQNTIEALKQQIASDRKQYKTSLNNLVNKVSEETSRAIDSLSRQQEATMRAAANRQLRSNSGPVGNGNFAEYTVQPGATLSAIAKAYHVSVNDIKRANGLSSHIIRVGQKLYIPQ